MSRKRHWNFTDRNVGRAAGYEIARIDVVVRLGRKTPTTRHTPDVHPTKRADFSRHGYRAAHFDDAFARFLPHEPNIRTLKSGRERL